MNKIIAVPVDANGILDGHFGHCKFFEIITLEGDEIVSQEQVIPPPHEPGVLPKWLADMGATDIIVGGIGRQAQNLFAQNNIKVFMGVTSGTARKLVENYFNNLLDTGGNLCTH